ncbi:MAG: N-acetyltransferase [Desulfobacterales bacterium]|uniref:N-acetyltransferase n=1 Tax=Candidatus Desulfatibia vada TaxID=2841696 RepID=A0A8J6TPA7_9BACT|nr:N-acetyltransferase [Candidatus Desulfatibia vada]
MEIYKLQIVGSKDILGLISLERIPEEWRIHVRLLTVSKENKGSSKQFDNIAGNLLTHAAKLAVKDFGELACVSLRPKTQIADHYIRNYGMKVTGRTLSIEVPDILTLINTYDNE